MSTLKYDTWQNNAGTKTYYGAQAWVNWNGTGVVAIRSSKNVTSITDNNTGDYTVNITTALADANYAVVGTGVSASATLITSNIAVAGTVAGGATTKTTTAVRMLNAGTGSAVDSAEQNVLIFAN